MATEAESLPYPITVQVLDTEIELDQFDFSLVPEEIQKYELGGLEDPFGQGLAWLWENICSAFETLSQDIWNWLRTIRDQITSAIQTAIDTLGDAINTTLSALSDTINSINQTLQSFVDQVMGAFESLQTAITQVSNTIAGIVTSIQEQFTNVTNVIQNLISQVTGLVNTIITQVSFLATSIYNYIQTFGQTVYNYITTAFDSFKDWLQTAWQTISVNLASLSTTLVTFSQQLFTAMQDVIAGINTFANQVLKGITETWTKIQTFLTEKYNELVRSVGDVQTVLQGFVNPLVSISKLLEQNLVAITSFFTDLKDKFITWIETTTKFFEDPVKFLSDIAKQINTFIEQAQAVLTTFTATVWEIVTSIQQTIQAWFEETAKTVIADLSERTKAFFTSPFEAVKTELGKFKEITGELDILPYIAMGYAVEAAKAFTPIATAEALGEALGDQEVNVAPMGLGAKIKLKLGSILKSLAKNMGHIFKDTVRYSFAGMAFWTVEPFRYKIYEKIRNTLPVQIPTVTEMITFVRRHMAHESFPDVLKKAKEVMALRGYSDYFIDLVFLTHAEKAINITDRFGKARVLPISTMYDLPTKSDWCRMMIHDIISRFDDFTKAMATIGVNRDIAFLYYLLHYRYPSLDKLWEFYCRGKAGMLRIRQTYLSDAERAMIAEGFGAPPAAPAQFNYGNAEKLLPMIAQYAKWHDYAFFGWKAGMPSDRLIMMELMARIPMRIDARWMFKWGIIDEKELKKVVIARAYHEDWVDKIARAEVMNALAEERTYARTGIINVFKEGFATLDLTKKTLSNLATIKILGKDQVVKFLDSEVTLLTLRAKYDRALDILRDYHKDLVKAYEENVIAWGDVTGALAETVKALNNILKINLKLDVKYYELYEGVAKSLKNVYTVRRIRYWLRYMLRTILTRFERGYITKSEIQEIIDEIGKFAKLTNEEKEALIEVAEMLLTVFNREILAKAILKKLSRGTITIEQAKRQLKELGLEEKIIDAMVEYYAKIYTISPSTLVSMMEYIPLPKDMLSKKLKAIGTPEDEAKLYPAYAFAKMISSEIGREVTELISDYAEGVITKDELKRELDSLATMDGRVKSLFGVDWIVLSPEEREIIINIAEKRRKRYMARRSRSS